MNKLNQWRAEKTYKAKLNLRAKIEREIAGELANMRKADDLLERCTRTSNGIEAQGYTNLPGCSRLEIHTVTTTAQPGSLVDNETFEACLVNGMAQAENERRNHAANV